MAYNIKLIEKKFYQNPKSISAKDLFLVAKSYYAQVDPQTEYKNRLKLLKTAGHYTIAAFKAGFDNIDDLILARKIVTEAMLVMPSPENFARDLSKIIKKWLELSGNDQIKILQTKKMKIQVETGMIVMSDPQECKNVDLEYNIKNMLELMNQGKIFAVGIGGDGQISLEFRLIDAIEPVLLPKEYTKLNQSSVSYNFKSSQGILGIGDYYNEQPEPRIIELITGPGIYQIAIFALNSGKVIIVTCKGKSANNEVTDIPAVEF